MSRRATLSEAVANTQVLYAADAEKAVLGSMLARPDAVIDIVTDKLGRPDFFVPAHQEVFDAICELHRTGYPVDLTTLHQYLVDQKKADAVGSPGILAELATGLSTHLNVGAYIKIVRDKSLLRHMQQEAAGIVQDISDSPDAPEFIQRSLARLVTLQTRLAGHQDNQAPALTIRDLAALDTKHDPNNVLGNRWLCKSGSCLWVGQAGIGKSSLALQAASHWALNHPIFGIAPEKPLKSLFIQAENDDGDLAEMAQGVLQNLLTDANREECLELLSQRIVFVRNSTDTGPKFIAAVRRLIAEHQPDLVWIDPLLSFAGDDISKTEVASRFLRQGLQPIALETGIVWMIMHHTPKPPSDGGKGKAHWNSHDYAYAGLGSSELTNWHRAITLLRPLGDGKFQLMLTKRGKRAGATWTDPETTTTEYGITQIYLQHADTGIYWHQVAKPVEGDPVTAPPRKVNKAGQWGAKYSADQIVSLMPVKSESDDVEGVKVMEIEKACREQFGMSKPTFWRLWENIKTGPRVWKNDAGYWFRVI
jgi:hypothetical protein